MNLSEFKSTISHSERSFDNELNEKTQNLEMILEIISKVNQSLDIDDVLNLVIKNALKLTDTDKGCIFLFSESTEKLEFRIGFNSNNERLPKNIFSHSNTVVNDVFSTGKSMYIQNALSDSSLNQCASILSLELQTIFCSPLQNRGNKIGVIYVDSRKLHDTKRKSTIETFEILAGQVTASIINAKLHSDLQKLSTLFVRSVLKLVNGDKPTAASFLGIPSKKLEMLIDKINTPGMAS